MDTMCIEIRPFPQRVFGTLMEDARPNSSAFMITPDERLILVCNYLFPLILSGTKIIADIRIGHIPVITSHAL